MIKGIDVSKWQGNIDWNKVKSDGIEFAILRSSYGRNTTSFKNKGIDEKFERNYKEAKRVGTPVGAYHYCYARNMKEMLEEAEFFLTMLKGKKFEYPIYLDIEDKNQSNINKKKLTNMVIAFCEKLEKAGFYVGIYANKYWLTTKLDYNKLKKYDIWLAEWTDKPTWNGNFGLWQYSSKGSVRGISGNVDMNISYKDYSVIKNKGFNGFSKTRKVETPKKETNNDKNENVKQYKIKNGNTLSGIAKKFGTTVDELVKINNIKNPNLIMIGEIIKIPTNSQPKKNYTYHTVKSGDTLSEIADKYKTTVTKLAKDNNIKNINLILPGQKLKIKK